MSKTSDNSKTVRWLPWLILLVVIVIWGISIAVLRWLFPEIGERGQFGDTFGVINALFSGLALGGVIYAILLQKEELALQREELAETRGEMKEQKLAMRKETFERTFFQFLEILDAKYHSTEYAYNFEVDVQSEPVQVVFERLKKRGSDVVSPQPHKIDGKTYLRIKDKGKLAFDSACREENWSRASYDMNPYFSLLFKVLGFIDQADFSENFKKKKFYTDILRDRMTNDELIVLFFLGLQPDWYLGVGHGNIDGEIFKKLIEKYSLFLNISLYGDSWKEKATFYDRNAFGDRERSDIGKIFEQNQRNKSA